MVNVPAVDLVGLELPVLRAVDQVLRLGGDLRERLRAGIEDGRRDQPFVERDADADVLLRRAA